MGAIDLLESVGALGSFVSGDVRDVFRQYDPLPEDLTTSGAFISGEVRDVRVDYTYGSEQLETAGEFISAAVRAALINYSNYEPEPIQASGSFVSGTLT